ncbi:hypothetical protein [Paenibacillus sp. JDR-2]|uniref:hypothetical protein n=1 Tax=Paenibacillus sp. (strain JDR-2) TaxID=324057 RepID=UPI0001664A7D|nr:hypothetical protein [Paenibacillus sp. JDR-2]ACT03903.1 hypothetical protein Pjdr2_5292 [Paenibacillus sp. JDR-2]
MNPNSYWYLGLSFICIVLQVIVFYRKRRVHTYMQFFIGVELLYIVEAVIYIFNGSYEYYPKLLSNRYYDSHLGALTSNLISIPSLALILSVFQLGWFWIVGFIALLAGIEWLFVELHIYTLYWWRIGYTSLGLLIYFPLIKKIYPWMLKARNGVSRAVLLFLCLGPISGTIQFLPFMLFFSRVYRPGWFSDPAQDTSAFGIVYYVSIVLVTTLLLMITWKYRWIKYACLETILIIVTVLLKQSGILISQRWWDVYLYLLFPMLLLIIGEIFAKHLARGESPEFWPRRSSERI